MSATYQFDIQQFGAKPDGRSLNTAAIQRAIDACHEAGGGRVACGPGTYVTGSIQLKSHVELHLMAGCRIVGSADINDYEEFSAEGFRGENAPEGCTHSLIRAVGAEHIAITGPGELDGAGLSFYDMNVTRGRFFAKPQRPRPRMVMFYRCRNVRIQETAFIDSPCWTIWLMKCERVTIHRARIVGDQRMINNDGIDLDSCRDVTVSDCTIKTGDDCIAIRSFTRTYDEPEVCENITITNCVLDSACQGVRIGCPGDFIIRNCVLNNLVIASKHNGILFENPTRYLPPGNGGSASVYDISISNVVINCEQTPIKVFVEDGIKLPRLGGLNFSNIRIHSGGPCVVEGSPETTIRDVTFDNITIATDGPDSIICRHCEDIQLNAVRLSNRKGS